MKRYLKPASILTAILLAVFVVGMIGLYFLTNAMMDCVGSLTLSTSQSIKGTKANTESRKSLVARLLEKDRELIRHKKAAVIYEHYRKYGMLNTHKDSKGRTVEGYYWITNDGLYFDIIIGEKYRPLSKKYNWDTLDPENMYLCYLSNGFNFCWFKDSEKKNWDGSRDHGLGDVNDINLYLFPDKGKGRDMYDPEKSIKVLYTLWGAGNYEGCWSIWNKFRPEVKELYYKLQKVR